MVSIHNILLLAALLSTADPSGVCPDAEIYCIYDSSIGYCAYRHVGATAGNIYSTTHFSGDRTCDLDLESIALIQSRTEENRIVGTCADDISNPSNVYENGLKFKVLCQTTTGVTEKRWLVDSSQTALIKLAKLGNTVCDCLQRIVAAWGLGGINESSVDYNCKDNGMTTAANIRHSGGLCLDSVTAWTKQEWRIEVEWTPNASALFDYDIIIRPTGGDRCSNSDPNSTITCEGAPGSITGGKYNITIGADEGPEAGYANATIDIVVGLPDITTFSIYVRTKSGYFLGDGIITFKLFGETVATVQPSPLPTSGPEWTGAIDVDCISVTASPDTFGG